MSPSAQEISNPYFQYISAREAPFGEQVFYWLHWLEDGKSEFIQVIVDFAQAKLITNFFLKAAEADKPAPAPVQLPALDLTCRPNDLTITARGSNRSRSLVFNRRACSKMSCALGMSGMTIRKVGGDFAQFPDLEHHSLYKDLAARSAFQEIRDLPAFHVLQEHPAFKDLAQRAMDAPGA